MQLIRPLLLQYFNIVNIAKYLPLQKNQTMDVALLQELLLLPKWNVGFRDRNRKYREVGLVCELAGWGLVKPGVPYICQCAFLHCVSSLAGLFSTVFPQLVGRELAGWDGGELGAPYLPPRRHSPYLNQGSPPESMWTALHHSRMEFSPKHQLRQESNSEKPNLVD